MTNRPFLSIPRAWFSKKLTIRLKLSTFNPFLGEAEASARPGFTFSRATSALIWKDREMPRRKRGRREGKERREKRRIEAVARAKSPAGPAQNPRTQNASRRPGTFPGFFNRYCDRVPWRHGSSRDAYEAAAHARRPTGLIG